MAAKLEKTTVPGIFRRHETGCTRRSRCNCPYVVRRPTMRTFRTMAEAREGKAQGERQAKLAQAHETGLHRTVPEADCLACERDQTRRDQTNPLLHDYALEWVERYQGTGKRGFREETRDDYRSLLKRYVLRYFDPEIRLSEVGPRAIAEFVGWLTKQPNGKGGTLSDKSIRNDLAPLSACLASARREGLIEHNPATGAALPHRPQADDDEDALPRPFPRRQLDGDSIETMELAISFVDADYRDMFELLAATGVRRSELIAVAGKHLVLDCDQPYVKVRQRAVRRKGEGMVIGALKTRHARRDLPIPCDLADRLLARGTTPDALVFAGQDGKPYDPKYLHGRVLAPACAKAGVPWAGFHTFRHTVASRLFEDGRNVVQVQKWLGHHAPSFTLDTYVHLLSDELPAPLTPLRLPSTPQTGARLPLPTAA